MRLRNLAVGAALLSAAAAHTQQPKVELSFGSDFYNKYVWRGLDLVDGPVWQPSVNAQSGPWSLNFWGSLELADTNDYGPGFGSGKDKFTEVDSTLTYAATSGDWDWSTGLVNYQFPNTGFRRTSEAFVTATLHAPLSPSLELYQDVDAVKGTSGNFSVSKSWGVKNGTLTAGAGTAFGNNAYTSYYFGAVESGLSEFDANLAFQQPIGGGATLSLYSRWSTVFDKDLVPGSGKRDNFVFGAGVAFGF